jgi:uncharacterized membrane protein
MVLLGRLFGGAFSLSTAVSSDGRTVIGYSDSDRSPGCCVFEMFRWTPEDGMSGLNVLGRPHAVCTDGLTIVGGLHSPDPGGAGFYWERGQLRRMHRVLISYRVGAPIEEYRVDTTYDMTPDGNTFVGVSRDAKGQRQAYIASIGPYCLIDWDHSGLINSQDVFAFLTSFFGGDGDFNGDGMTDSRDWLEFYNDWRFQDCF